jgi:hypothetical protein
MKKEHLEWLQANKVCRSSLLWIAEKNIQSLEEAWNICERGDWLLWMATKLNVDKRRLVLCAALCAHTVIQYMKDSRSRNAVRIAFLWGRGKTTYAQLEKAKTNALAAVIAARAVDTVTYAAAWAAAWATIPAEAIWAADITTDAALAAGDADADRNRLRTAEIARKVLTEDVMKKIKEIK